jgi:hypothetical protein
MNYLSMMQPLPTESLFSIFQAGDEEVYKEFGLEETLQNPFVLMGMVLNGLENFHMMDMMYKRNYPEEYKKVKQKVQYSFYNKLYSYLSKIPITPLQQVYKIGDSFESVGCNAALDHLRVYYEKLEEYKKCATIKQYIDLLSQNIPEKVAYPI